jgi:uncharacterized protein (TIGR03083 family)
MIAEQHVHLATRESEKLRAYINAIPEELLNEPTACDLWDVRDLIAHLIFAANYQMGMISRGLNGDYSTPEGLPQPGAVNAQMAGPLVHRMSIEVRDSAGDELLSLFNDTYDKFDDLVMSLDAQSLGTACYDARGICSAADLLDLRVLESALHLWDIKSRLDPPAELSPDVYPSLTRVISRSTYWLVWPSETPENSVHYRFHVDDLSPKQWDILISGNEVSIGCDRSRTPNVELTGDGESFLLFIFGRQSIPQLVADGRMRIDGDPELIAHLGKRFRGY